MKNHVASPGRPCPISHGSILQRDSQKRNEYKSTVNRLFILDFPKYTERLSCIEHRHSGMYSAFFRLCPQMIVRR